MLQQVHRRTEHIINPRFSNEDRSNPYQQADKIINTCMIFDEGQTLEPKIEGFSTSLSSDLNLLCIQEDHFCKKIHDVTTTRNQWHKD